MKEFFSKASELAAIYSSQAVIALLISLIGFWLARRLAEFLSRFLHKTHLEPTYIVFFGNAFKILLYVLVLLASLNTLGVQMTSVIALLGTAGIAVALALKDSLNNVAAGISLLILRPMRVGDYVEIGSVGGTVIELNFFHTFLNTPDNRRVAVPNSKVISDTIINFSQNAQRRIDMVFGVAYDSDLRKTRSVLEALIAADPRILADPLPVVAVGELAPSSVQFFVRPWVATPDYWDVRYDFIEKTKLAFDEAGIVIPFPQQDLHHYYPESSGPAAAPAAPSE